MTDQGTDSFTVILAIVGATFGVLLALALVSHFTDRWPDECRDAGGYVKHFYKSGDLCIGKQSGTILGVKVTPNQHTVRVWTPYEPDTLEVTTHILRQQLLDSAKEKGLYPSEPISVTVETTTDALYQEHQVVMAEARCMPIDDLMDVKQP